MSTIERLEKRLARAKQARQTAETLLEEKALELFEANQKLAKEVDIKSRQAEDANEQLEIAQSRLFEAMETMPDRFAVFDRDQRLIFMNNAYATPYANAGSPVTLGMMRSDIIRSAFKLGNVDAEIQDCETWVTEECARWDSGNFISQTTHTANGQWIKLTERRMSTGDILTVRNDLTVEKQRQAELDTALQQAEDASRAKSIFLANMSHEIRTPMNGVVGMAELLAETDLSDEQSLFANTIKSSAEALTVIINDILDYSKIEAGQMELFVDPFDLEQTLMDVLMVLHPKATEKSIDLLIDYDMFLPSNFIGDAGRFRQMFLNLIGNAIKFTETGSVSIGVVGVESDDGLVDLRITVQDTGIGIPEDKLDHVFASFKQVDETENRKFEGTGLGLAITKQLVDLMGGQIWVTSEYGDGSCFGIQVSLPKQPPHKKTSCPAPPALGRALVVDDTLANLTILERQLKHLGFEVSGHADCQQALEAFEQNPHFDIIFLDHNMPVMSGVELAEVLRERKSTAPMFLVSSDMNANAKAMPKGLFNRVLHKPMMRAQLKTALETVFKTGGQKRVAPVLHKQDVRRPARTPSGRPLKLLLAEDNRTNQLVFTKMVAGLNIELTVVENGRKAVEAFQSSPPEAIITDISMPEMDGMEATKIIRELEGRGPSIPIYALTAHAMLGDKERFMEVGMNGYLTKPLKKADIVQTIEDLIAIRDLAAESAA